MNLQFNRHARNAGGIPRLTPRSVIGTIAMVCFFILIFAVEDCDGCFSPSTMAIKFFACGLIMIVGSIYYRILFLKTEDIIHRIDSVPLIKTCDATDGVPFSGEGIIIAEPDRLLLSPYMTIPCVYYHSVTEKLVRSGKSSHWEVVVNNSDFVPFYFEDDQGRLKVDLVGTDSDFSNFSLSPKLKGLTQKYSEIDCEPVLRQQNTSMKPRSFLSLTQTDQYRRSEYVLKPNMRVFVYGVVGKTDEGLVVKEDENSPLIISRKSHDEYIDSFYQGNTLIYFVHFFVSIGYTVALVAANYFVRFDQTIIAEALVIGNTLIIGSIMFTAYNRTISLKQRAVEALSNIEIELERRGSLIPQLVSLVRGYAKYESEVQLLIAETRAQLAFRKDLPNEIAGGAPSLLALAESYPELKASENFRALAEELSGTEDRIAYSRMFYNEHARKYNTLISQFPILLLAKVFSMKTMDFITITRGEGADVSVQL